LIPLFEKEKAHHHDLVKLVHHVLAKPLVTIVDLMLMFLFLFLYQMTALLDP